MNELKDRLTELEIRFTHQAQLIEELNEVLTGACARLARLEQENRSLREQIRQATPDDFTLSPDE
jgi:SlyX protein